MNRIKLIAVASEDGWALVRDEEDVLLARPPFMKTFISTLSRSMVEKAVAGYGFTREDKEFSNWKELIEHLKDRMVKTRKARGETAPDSSEIRKLVKHAPKRILSDYMDQVQKEWLPNHEWEAVQDLLTTLIGLEKIRGDDELFNRAVDLLKRCHDSRRRFEKERSELLDREQALSSDFPLACLRYGAEKLLAFSSLISRQNCIFPMSIAK